MKLVWVLVSLCASSLATETPPRPGEGKVLQVHARGKRQALAQGRWLRQHYGQVIGNLYSPK
ncbi:hypothetical protein B566_EDAN016046, partial [Ephemera danica]